MKLLNFSFILFLALVMSSCKKDLGNYEYTNTLAPVVDTTGLGGTHQVLRYDNLLLAPQIRVENDHPLSYQWLLYIRNRSSTAEPKVVELSTEENLNVAIGEPIGLYTVELIVTDQETGLKTNTLFNVDITSGLDYGMLVLYQNTDGGDVDFIKTPAHAPGITSETHLKGIYSGTMGEKLHGEAKFIWASRFSTVNWISVGSSNQITRFHGDDFAFLRQQEQLFRRVSPSIAPEAYIYTGAYYNVLINNGKMQVTNITIEGDAKFGGEASGDYQLAPYLTEKVSSSLQAVGYDQRHGRFVRYFATSNTMVDFAAPANTEQKFDLRNIGKDMLYMTGGAQNRTYSFFKDKSGTGRWLYVTNFGGFTTDNGQLAINTYEMTHLPEIANAKLYLVSGLGAFAYYATDSKVYNYTYGAGNSASIAFQTPAGEQITAIEFYRPRPTSGLADREERTLYLATWNGTVGKVYELSINETSGEIVQTPQRIFEIAGRVVHLTSKVR